VTCSQPEVLQTVVDEYSNLSPQTTNVFIFRKHGETIAANQATTEDQTKPAIANFADLAAKTELIGNLESLTINGVSEQLIISTIDDLYLATVSSKKANLKTLRSLSQVLIPTIVRLIDQQNFDKSEEVPQTFQAFPEEEPVEESVVSQEELTVDSTFDSDEAEISQTLQNLPEEEAIEESVMSQEESNMDSDFEPESSMEPALPKPPINQLMIEKIKGMLVASDTVRVDSEVIEGWTELYGDKALLVNIQTLDGKTTTCKFKPAKESKSNAKGIIQIPEKILQTLQASKGQLVMVSPEIA
jgi:predicted regulator of Ras-like GTPase activity (Roadblock/LC7/MglB family)